MANDLLLIPQVGLSMMVQSNNGTVIIRMFLNVVIWHGVHLHVSLDPSPAIFMTTISTYKMVMFRSIVTVVTWSCHFSQTLLITRDEHTAMSSFRSGFLHVSTSSPGCSQWKSFMLDWTALSSAMYFSVSFCWIYCYNITQTSGHVLI